jgi:ABC-type sugar transport system permease subunit
VATRIAAAPLVVVRDQPPRKGLGLAPAAWVAITLYGAFLIFPLLRSVYLSLTDTSPLQAGSEFVGLDNYAELFTDDRLRDSLIFTAIVVVFVTVLANAIGIALALLLNRSTANYRVMRTIVFIPQVLSGVIVAFTWRSILTQDGLLNAGLVRLGLVDKPVAWLGSSELATLSIAAVVSWITIAFCTVVYTAALQGVPAELYEAARMDGAGPFGRFRHVTLPMIAPGMTVSVVLCLITTFKLYDIIAVLTGGGPANSTQSTAYYLITVAFSEGRFGFASAIAMLLLALTAAIAYVVTTLLRRREASL